MAPSENFMMSKNKKKTLVKRSEFTKKAIVLLKRRLMKLRKRFASNNAPFSLYNVHINCSSHEPKTRSQT